MSDTVDTFLSNYDMHVSAADTAIQQLRADIAKIQNKEMEPGIKSSKITAYAEQKQKLFRKINAIEKEKTEAAKYKTQLSPVQKQVSDIDATIVDIEAKENEVDKPSEVTPYAIQKAQLYETRKKLIHWLKEVDTGVGKLKYF